MGNCEKHGSDVPLIMTDYILLKKECAYCVEEEESQDE